KIVDGTNRLQRKKITAKTPLLSNDESGENDKSLPIQHLEEKFNTVTTSIEDLKKQISLSIPLLSNYQDKKREESALRRLDDQLKNVKKEITWIERLMQIFKPVALTKDQPEESSKKQKVESKQPPKETKPTWTA